MFYDFLCLSSKGLSMPIHLVGDVGEGISLESLGQNACWFSLCGSSLIKCCNKSSNIMTINLDSMETKALHSLLVGVDVVSKRSGVRLELCNLFEYLVTYIKRKVVDSAKL